MNPTATSLLITLALLSTAAYLYWRLTPESLEFDLGDEDESEYC